MSDRCDESSAAVEEHFCCTGALWLTPIPMPLFRCVLVWLSNAMVDEFRRIIEESEIIA